MPQSFPLIEISAPLAPEPISLTIEPGCVAAVVGLPEKRSRLIARAAAGAGAPRSWEIKRGGAASGGRSPALLARTACLGPERSLGSLRPRAAIAEAAALFGLDPAAPRLRAELRARGWDEKRALASPGADAWLELWLAREREPDFIVSRDFLGRLPLVGARRDLSDWLAETAARGGGALLLETDPAPLLALRPGSIGALYCFRGERLVLGGRPEELAARWLVAEARFDASESPEKWSEAAEFAAASLWANGGALLIDAKRRSAAEKRLKALGAKTAGFRPFALEDAGFFAGS